MLQLESSDQVPSSPGGGAAWAQVASPSLLFQVVVVELGFNTSNAAEYKSQIHSRCNFCFRALIYLQCLDGVSLLLFFQSESSGICETRAIGLSFSSRTESF